MSSQSKVSAASADPSDVLAVVKSSPVLVAAHNKAAWLALFSRTAEIEDPVGSTPYKRDAQKSGAADPLELFYETLIAPTEIDMRSSLDIVAGLEVARDVVIRTKLPSGAMTDVAAYLHYQTVVEDDALRVARIGAHWEMTQTLLGTMSQGLRGLSSVMAVTWRLLRVQGLSGMIGYSRGMLPGIGDQGTSTVERFVVAVASRDAQALSTLFTEHDAVIEWPIGQSQTPAEFLTRLPAGARFRFERPKNSGYVTACRFTLGDGKDPEQSGIAFFHFDKDSRRIEKARFFV